MSDSTAPTTELPPYEVVNVRYADLTDGHEHVEAVRTRDPDGGQTEWDWTEVVGAIRGGERFVVAIGGTRAATILETSVCPVCPAATLRFRSPSTV